MERYPGHCAQRVPQTREPAEVSAARPVPDRHQAAVPCRTPLRQGFPRPVDADVVPDFWRVIGAAVVDIEACTQGCRDGAVPFMRLDPVRDGQPAFRGWARHERHYFGGSAGASCIHDIPLRPVLTAYRAFGRHMA